MILPDAAAIRSRAGGLLCVLLLLACVLISHPVAEIGINDDWSYIRSARLMAETGHFMYVGWASAMLGWMVPLGALFVKVFGFSFTVVRASSVLVAMVTAYLFQRCFVWAGLNAWNATLTALTFVLSPIYLPLATTYMTDLPGVGATLVCLYGCLRALRTSSDAKAAGWLAGASVAASIGGTARQTAWLALFIMVPSAGWLLRKRRLPWILLGLVWAGSVAFTELSMRWFSHQPYSLREAVVAGYVDRDLIYAFFEHVTRATLDSFLLLLPLTVAFLPLARMGEARVRRWYLGAVAATVLFALFVLYRHTFTTWLAPFDGNYFTEKGLVDLPEIGVRRPMFAPSVRLILTAFTWVCTVATVAYLATQWRAKSEGEPATEQDENLRQMAILIVPYSLVYGLLLVHRAIFSQVFDRYLLALLFVPALLLVLWYQQRVAPRLPNASVAVLVVFGLFATAANHDLFSMERARVEVANQLTRAGVARTQFYGGWEYDGWTQLDRYGFANSGYMNTPHGFTATAPIVLTMTTKPCNYWAARIAAAIQPQYAISFDPTSCAGPSQFPSVGYRSWLPPYGARLYVQRVAERVY